MIFVLDGWEHSREGSDWVDDIQGHPRGRVTEDVRKFAAQQQISEEQALKVGLEQKAREFVEKGAEVYAKAE